MRTIYKTHKRAKVPRAATSMMHRTPTTTNNNNTNNDNNDNNNNNTNTAVSIESMSVAGGVVTGVSSIAISGTATVGATFIADTGDVRLLKGDLQLSSTAAQSITHIGASGADFGITSGNGNVVISSTNNDVSIESVTVAGGVDTDVRSIDISGAATVGTFTVETGDVTIMKGDVLFSSTEAQSITHVGADGSDFSLISTSGNVAISSTNAGVSVEDTIIDVDVVTGVNTIDVNGAAVVGSLIADTGNVNMLKGDLMTSSTSAQSVIHTGASGADFSMISTNGTGTVGNLVTDTGDIDVMKGDLLMSSTSAQTIAHIGAGGEDLSITSTSNGNVAITSSNAGVLIEGVTMDLGVITGVQSIDVLSGAVAGNLVADFSLTSTNGNVAISSTNADVLIESVTIANVVVSGVSSIDVVGVESVGNLIADTGNVNVAKGDAVFPSTVAQGIIHTGANDADFTITSTDGNVAIESTNADVSIESATVALRLLAIWWLTLAMWTWQKAICWCRARQRMRSRTLVLLGLTSV